MYFYITYHDLPRTCEHLLLSYCPHQDFGEPVIGSFDVNDLHVLNVDWIFFLMLDDVSQPVKTEIIIIRCFANFKILFILLLMLFFDFVKYECLYDPDQVQ